MNEYSCVLSWNRPDCEWLRTEMEIMSVQLSGLDLIKVREMEPRRQDSSCAHHMR